MSKLTITESKKTLKKYKKIGFLTDTDHISLPNTAEGMKQQSIEKINCL